MNSVESNFDDWREIRARVDSIANVVFLIGGGALSLSITVVLGNLEKFELTQLDMRLVEYAWWLLLFSIILALLLKILLVFEKYMLLVNAEFTSKHFMKLNYVGWIIGMASFFSFCGGLWLMVSSASQIMTGQP